MQRTATKAPTTGTRRPLPIYIVRQKPKPQSHSETGAFGR
jgi:hypothetical protein